MKDKIKKKKKKDIVVKHLKEDVKESRESIRADKKLAKAIKQKKY